MKNAIKALYRMISLMMVSVLTVFIPVNAAEDGSKDVFILQCEFASLLFDRLELAEENVVLTKEQKIKGLEEFRFAPPEGYRVGDMLRYDGLVVILVRVYGLEDRLPSPYTVAEARDLLVERKILKDTDKLEDFVLYVRAIEIIKDIEPIPGYKPGLILLPRVPVGPDVSPTE